MTKRAGACGAVIGMLAFGHAALTSAQDIAPRATNADALPLFRLPVLSATFGAGTVSQSDAHRLMKTASVECFFTREFALQAEFGSATASNPDNEPASHGAASLIYATEARRVRGFIGIGVLVDSRAITSASGRTNCASNVVAVCETRPSPSAVFQGTPHTMAGIDARIAGPLHAYGTVTYGLLENIRLSAHGGLRVIALARSGAGAARWSAGYRPQRMPDVSAAAGTRVRITLANGERFSRTLVSMNDTTLTVRGRSGQERYPMDRVRIVERTSRATMTGAIVGALAGTFVAQGIFEDSKVLGALAIAPFGASAGTLIGGATTYANRSGNVLYLR